MSTKKKVISIKSLPVRFPFISTAVIYLYLDKYHAPQWLWGVMATLLALVLGAVAYGKYNQQEVDIFDDKNGSKS